MENQSKEKVQYPCDRCGEEAYASKRDFETDEFDTICKKCFDAEGAKLGLGEYQMFPTF